MQCATFSDRLLLLSIALKLLNILQMRFKIYLNVLTVKFQPLRKYLKKILHCSGPLSLRRRKSSSHQSLLPLHSGRHSWVSPEQVHARQTLRAHSHRRTAHWTPGENASSTPQGRNTWYYSPPLPANTQGPQRKQRPDFIFGIKHAARTLLALVICWATQTSWDRILQDSCLTSF